VESVFKKPGLGTCKPWKYNNEYYLKLKHVRNLTIIDSAWFYEMHLKTYNTIWCFRVNMSGQLDQNFHLHDWWRNSCTYGPGSVLVLVNEALEPLEKAKPRRFTIIKSLLRGTHQDLLLDQVSRKRNSWWCMTYFMGRLETTFNCLFIHIWWSYRNPGYSPIAMINTRCSNIPQK